MFGFVHSCQRHRQMFADTVARVGCTDPEEIAKVRCRLFAWFSAKYPMLVLEQFSNAACIGCAYEEAKFDTTPIYDAICVMVSRIRIEARQPPQDGRDRHGSGIPILDNRPQSPTIVVPPNCTNPRQ
jgi:hypothetical protein